MSPDRAETPHRRARNARAEILDAGQRVASRDGAARLTIDAVAREVGLTKGGSSTTSPPRPPSSTPCSSG